MPLDGHPQINVGWERSKVRKANQCFLDRVECGVINVVIVAREEFIARVTGEEELLRSLCDNFLAHVTIHHHASNTRQGVQFQLHFRRPLLFKAEIRGGQDRKRETRNQRENFHFASA